MILLTWLQREKTIQDAFFAWWQEQNLKSPTDFPLDNLPGDWDEQYLDFYTNVWLPKQPKPLTEL